MCAGNDREDLGDGVRCVQVMIERTLMTVCDARCVQVMILRILVTV